MKTTKTDLNQTLWVKESELQADRKRRVIDANGLTLGRVAELVARKLQGKDKVHYMDHRDTGDYVVVQNTDKITVTGTKFFNKFYHTYSGHKGHVKTKSFKTLMASKPTEPLFLAVRGMLPKNRLRDLRMKRLKLVTGSTTKYDHLSLESVTYGK